MPHSILAFLVNGDAAGAMGIRAQSFADRLANEFNIRIVYRSQHKVQSILAFLAALRSTKPDLCYVFDMGYSGVLAGGLYCLFSRCRLIIDTGDAIYELSRSTGNRGRLGVWLTKLLEWFGLRVSDRVIVRSHPHQELLARTALHADVIPDGVDTVQFSPAAEDQLRKQYGLDGYTVVGVLGSLVWSPRWQMCYGWELIEVIHQLRDRPVMGLVIGDGSGLARLKERCIALGVEDRVVFVGRIPYRQLPRFINLMDICLSTQTNDTAGQVRTTGKLPIYLACGRFVLASQVGEAARVLPAEMLVPYTGAKDIDYPGRLTARIASLLDYPERLQQGAAGVAIAKALFDYDVLAASVRTTIRRLLSVPGIHDALVPADDSNPANVNPGAGIQRN